MAETRYYKTDVGTIRTDEYNRILNPDLRNIRVLRRISDISDTVTPFHGVIEVGTETIITPNTQYMDALSMIPDLSAKGKYVIRSVEVKQFSPIEFPRNV